MIFAHRCLLALSSLVVSHTDIRAQDEPVDATDPTKIYTFAGGGLKYTDYTNGESMIEARATGNIALTESDTLLFEFGYGWHDGDLVPGSNNNLTNLRFRWFHLYTIRYDVEKGYRGKGINLDLQLAGNLKGTNGQNVLVAGIMPVFALGGDWDLYLTTAAVGSWDKKWENFNGAGVSVNAQFIYSPSNWWQGAQIQIIPDYKYFLTGSLDGEGSGNLDFNIGGNFTNTVTWDATYQKNFDVDLNSHRRGMDTGLENDWNVFFNVTTYF